MKIGSKVNSKMEFVPATDTGRSVAARYWIAGGDSPTQVGSLCPLTESAWTLRYSGEQTEQP
jgi:hypothetical protein